MLEKYAINRLSNFVVFIADWSSRVVHLVFRANEFYAVLVPVPTGSLQVGLDLVSAPSCPGSLRLGLELIKIRFVKINPTYNLTLNKCNPN